MNLKSLMLLALLGEKVGVDLWQIPSEEDPAIRRALDFLLPFALAPEAWEYEQVLEFRPERIVPLIEQARLQYPERMDVYTDALSKIESAGDYMGFYELP